MSSKQLFTIKLQAKEGAKIKLFMLLLIKGYFLWCITVFGGLFVQFFPFFFTRYDILHDKFNFFHIFFLGYVYTNNYQTHLLRWGVCSKQLKYIHK